MRIKQRRTFERSDADRWYSAYDYTTGEMLECRDVVTLFQMIAKNISWRVEHGLTPGRWIVGGKGIAP